MIIGIIPTVGALIMLVHCTLLSFGILVKLTEWIFDCSIFGFIAWIIVSLAYGFCWVHRAFATYGVLISFCIDFQRSFGFGVLRQPLHLLMVALGLLLFFVFIKKKAWYEFYDRNINHLNK
nr:hypothetical protein [Prevotella sp.]